MKKLSERISLLASIIGDASKKADNDASSATSDFYVYCNPYLKDKSGKE